MWATQENECYLIAFSETPVVEMKVYLVHLVVSLGFVRRMVEKAEEYIKVRLVFLFLLLDDAGKKPPARFAIEIDTAFEEAGEKARRGQSDHGAAVHRRIRGAASGTGHARVGA
jgi:hypothetical protein